MNHEKLRLALEKRGYQVSVFDSASQAAEYLVSQIVGCTVGFGDSATLAAMDLASRLSECNQVFDPGSCPDEAFLETAKKALNTEIFLTSVNGVAETGELINLDGTGNRVAGSLFGHKKVYFVFGRNKIESTLEQAIWRARNIAAPINAKRLGYRTPCAIKGDRCYDCSSPDRICNALVIYYGKMHSIEAEVILIDEALGY